MTEPHSGGDWCNWVHSMASCWTSHSQPVLDCPSLTIAWHVNLSFMSSWSRQCPECLWPNLVFFTNILLVFSKCFCLFQTFCPVWFGFCGSVFWLVFFKISHLVLLIPPSKESQIGACHGAPWAAFPHRLESEGSRGEPGQWSYFHRKWITKLCSESSV